MTKTKRHCKYCKREFEVDNRVAKRQYACNSIACQQKRKKENQSAWLTNNPDYFKGRYPELKAWLANNPGYLTAYRQGKRWSRDIQDELIFDKTIVKSVPASVIRVIQDQLTACVNEQLPKIDPCLPHDIQDELILNISMSLLAYILIYKSRLLL